MPPMKIADMQEEPANCQFWTRNINATMAKIKLFIDATNLFSVSNYRTDLFDPELKKA